jgi:hypothetical protein
MITAQASKFVVGGLALLFLASNGRTMAQGQPGNPNATGAQTPHQVLDGTATLVGPFNPNQMLRLALGLQPPHLAEEEQFLRDLQTKGSPLFHQFLTPEEWDARFAPSVQDEQAVVDWAQAQGLTVTKRYPNRLLVDVEANVATIQKAFQISINNYQFGSKTYFSNDRDPVIPESLTSILHSVAGLNNIQVLHPAHRGAVEHESPIYVPGPVVAMGESRSANGDITKLPAAGASSQGFGLIPNITNGAYDPTDIYSSQAYDFTALYNQGHCCNPLNNDNSSPPEASIAIATAYSLNGNDIVGFHNQYPYLAYNYQEVYIDSGGQKPPVDDPETTMDVEWSTAMANSFGAATNTAKVYVYEGVDNHWGTFHDVYNQILTDDLARVFSTSWGCQELWCASQAWMDSYHAIFNNMVGVGWTLVAASGDQGASAGCDWYHPSTSVQYPASDPNIVGAGGTTLSLSSGPVYVSEVGWSGGPEGCGYNDGGSTGGFSQYYNVPDFQSGMGFSRRAVPDIALSADWYSKPQNIYYGGSLQGNGGTSIVAPEMAGFFAQENAYLVYLGSICGNGAQPCAPMGNANYFLYDIGKNGAAHYPYYDITSGCNSNDITTLYGLKFYCAGPGYDQVTGWGSMNALQLAWGINLWHVPGYTTPVITFTGPATNHWYNTDQLVRWTITTPSGNGAPSDGLAGYSRAWDSDPGGDPYSEPHPGTGNSFYSGPGIVGLPYGCIDFSGSCSGTIAVGQGLHTVHVRAWGNEGEGSSDVTYGPLGYDTTPPQTTASLSGTKISGTTYKSPVTVTLTATDPGAPTTGSGIASTVYQVNSEGLKNYVGPFTVSYPGSFTVTFHSIDNAGNVETDKSTSFTIKALLSLSPGALAFGNQVLNTTSAAKTITLTNLYGSAAIPINSITPSGDFAIPTNNCGASLAKGGKCTFTVTFTPSVVGSIAGKVTVSYVGEGTPALLGLNGTGLAPTSLSPTSLAFGAIAVGTTSASKAVTLTNNESTALNISLAASDDYSISSTTCGATLAANTSCTINVTFSPKQNGATNGAVTVTYNAELSPQIVALSGSGTGAKASPLTFTPGSLSFKNVAVGASANATVTVKNSSASTVTILGLTGSGDYSATGCLVALKSKATCVMTVTFTPSTTGMTRGSVAIANDSSLTPEIYNVSGTAILPFTLSPTSLTFASQAVGTLSATQTVTMSNNLNMPVQIAYGASGEFIATASGYFPCGAVLPALSTCTFSVTFAPTQTGSISGVTTVVYSGNFSPQEVKLTGTGN